MLSEKSVMNVSHDELEKIIKSVNVEFYEMMYEDPWLKEVFKNIDIEFITEQQTDFILMAFGGPKRYRGRNPKDAHPHILITDEMWEVRESYLRKAFEKVQAPEWLSQKWLGIDNAFKESIINREVSNLKPRYATDDYIVVHKPFQIKKAG